MIDREMERRLGKKFENLEYMIEQTVAIRPKYLTRDQAAEMLGVKPITIDLWCKAGKELKDGRRYQLEKIKGKGISHMSVIRLETLLKT